MTSSIVFTAYLALNIGRARALLAHRLNVLIGADLRHLHPRDISKLIASIGGAGTFDGIVLSGIVAAYLA